MEFSIIAKKYCKQTRHWHLVAIKLGATIGQIDTDSSTSYSLIA